MHDFCVPLSTNWKGRMKMKRERSKWRDLLCSASIGILRVKLNRRGKKNVFSLIVFNFCSLAVVVCVCLWCVGYVSALLCFNLLARAMCFCLWAWLLSSLWNTNTTIDRLLASPAGERTKNQHNSLSVFVHSQFSHAHTDTKRTYKLLELNCTHEESHTIKNRREEKYKQKTEEEKKQL